jgi:hypothetical protein
MVNFSHYQTQLEYGIISWGSSTAMKSIFAAQKRAVRVMLRLSPRSSCKEGFKRLGILTVPCLYTYSMMMFVVRNRNIYQSNNAVHHRYTRQFGKLHVSSVRIS